MTTYFDNINIIKAFGVKFYTDQYGFRVLGKIINTIKTKILF